jgi:hypothetical protein
MSFVHGGDTEGYKFDTERAPRFFGQLQSWETAGVPERSPKRPCMPTNIRTLYADGSGPLCLISWTFRRSESFAQRAADLISVGKRRKAETAQSRSDLIGI